MALTVFVAGLILLAACGKGSCQDTFMTNAWGLWTNGTLLRGANIYQRRVYPEIDGTNSMGPGPVGPPYIQADFDRLADVGANYVNISHPGLYTETDPPYQLDVGVQSNLDMLVNMVGDAGMFAVISFRTGPGRTEFSLLRAGSGHWFPSNWMATADVVWTNGAAQDAWLDMWQYTAGRYRDDPVVVGYDLMVEPNAAHAYFDTYNPVAFYTNYAGTLYDWNQLHPRITAAVRAVDLCTPVLIGAGGYSHPGWLRYLRTNGYSRCVYIAHQYGVSQYTHQGIDAGYSYPGFYDLDGDAEADDYFDRIWLSNRIDTVADYRQTNNVPVAINEFGVVRYAAGAAQFLEDETDLLEVLGINHAVWMWHPSWEPWRESNDSFNLRHGNDPANHVDISTNPMMRVMTNCWSRNRVAPTSRTRLIGPRDAEIVTAWRPEFSWTPIPGTAWYQVQVDRDGNVIFSEWLSQSNSVFTPDFDMLAGSYRWRVRSWGALNGVGGWSSWALFSMPSRVPTSTVPTAPAGTITSSPQEFVWADVDHATWYRLHVERNSEECLATWIRGQTNYVPESSLDYGRYQWKVRTWSPDGYGPWSGSEDFAYGTCVAVCPTGTVTNTRQPEFTWLGPAGAIWHNVWVNRNGQPYKTRWVNSPTSWIPSAGLPGGEYCWWVRAWKEGAGAGPWSLKRSFTVPEATPAGIVARSPTGAVVGADVTYAWQGDVAATWYRLWINCSNEQWHAEWYNTGSVTGLVTQVVSQHTEHASYSWWVRGWGPDGFGEWSGKTTFTIE